MARQKKITVEIPRDKWTEGTLCDGKNMCALGHVANQVLGVPEDALAAGHFARPSEFDRDPGDTEKPWTRDTGILANDYGLTHEVESRVMKANDDNNSIFSLWKKTRAREKAVQNAFKGTRIRVKFV